MGISATADDSSRAPSGVVHVHRVELRNTGNASARAVVVSVMPDAQALQLPLSCESAGCVSRSDGGVEIAEIAAGSAVVLRQSLRIKPGYRGAVRNDWEAGANGSSVKWRQELTAYAADVAVTVGDATGTIQARGYEVTLTNQGPDEAVDVSWDLLTLPGQVWRVVSCIASTGTSCPTTLGEAMKIARLPANASLRLQVEVDESVSARLGGIASRADTAGDPEPSNNEATVAQSAAEHLFMTDLEGRHYRLSIGVTGPLRATAKDVDYRAPFVVDVTGAGFLGDGSANPLWSRGLVNFWGPVMVLGLDIGGVRKPYLAPRQRVVQLSELEGFSFNVLGSRADASGKPQDAYVGSARFKDGAFELCLPDAPTAVEQCPATRLNRFEAAMVGSEIELVSKDRVMRLSAARSADGPVLISSTRDPSTGASAFWVALPNGSRGPFGSGDLAMHEATFESLSGQSMTVMGEVNADAAGAPRISATPRGLPNIVLQVLNTGGPLGVCGLTAQLSASSQPGLFQGTLQGDWLPGTYKDGQFIKERACFAGPVHHAQTTELAVFVGARGGDLMGRWMFVGN
ncbi:hypothetical protein ASC95_11640 [Pelomonas sp. Root1217]|nr:hypothetical protein ASC95_11640 [Pelomonas sp. Root1217]